MQTRNIMGKPKLVSKVIEALPMSKCYWKNLRGSFCNYTNTVSVSKYLYAKVEEMLTQSERKHDTECFVQLISVILFKKVKKYFSNTKKSARTLLASRLAYKMFSFVRSPSRS